MRRWRSDDGVALIMVLWAIVILSFLLLSLTEDIQLESYLTRNLMEQTQLLHIADAGIARGIAELKGDLTFADTKTESWCEIIRGMIEETGTFEVKIEDIGSEFNLNFVGSPIIDYLMPNYAEEFKVWRVENYPFYMLEDVMQFPNSEDFRDLTNKTTFYGKFNVNTDDTMVLNAIMQNMGIPEWIASRVSEEIGVIEEPLSSIEDLLLHVPSMDMATFNQIKDVLTVQGNININLVDEGTLVILLESLKIHRDLATAIIEQRDREGIYDLNELDKLLGEESVKQLKIFFDVKSTYFRITCTAKSTTTALEKNIVIELERIPERVARDRVLEWGTKILSWVES